MNTLDLLDDKTARTISSVVGSLLSWSAVVSPVLTSRPANISSGSYPNRSARFLSLGVSFGGDRRPLVSLLISVCDMISSRLRSVGVGAFGAFRALIRAIPNGDTSRGLFNFVVDECLAISKNHDTRLLGIIAQPCLKPAARQAIPQAGQQSVNAIIRTTEPTSDENPLAWSEFTENHQYDVQAYINKTSSKGQYVPTKEGFFSCWLSN